MNAIDPFLGMRLRCVRCREQTEAYRESDDPPSVCRCGECGKRHSTDSLEVI
ncbi:MAG: hypothetical protein ACOCUA_02885 [archaeon]